MLRSFPNKRTTFFTTFGLLLVALVQPTLRAHENNRSLSQLDWNDADGSVELVMQIHRHELETKLSLMLDQRLSFLTNDDFGTLETATRSYLATNVAVRVDDKPVEMIFIGIEVVGETIIAYLETDWAEQPRSLGFMNSILLADLPGQINTVVASVNGVRTVGDITGGSAPLRFKF